MIVTTDFSLFKSSIQLETAIELSKGNGFCILADNNLNAVPQFVFGCRKKNIKPIVSTLKQLTYAVENRDKPKEKKYIPYAEYLFISLNKKGYQELLYYETKGYSEDIFNSKNIISILNDIYVEDKVIYPKYALKRNSLYEGSVEDLYNKTIDGKDLIVLSPMIINSENEDNHYVVSALEAIGDKRYMEEKSFVVYSNSNSGFNDNLFLDLISDIEDYFEFGNPLPPKFKFTEEVAIKEGLEGEVDDNLLFRHLVLKGLKERFKNREVPQEYLDRVSFEMDVIEQMKFPGYFLIVWDFINYAKEKGIPVGPGRGSAAGALIAWALKITNIDPLPNGLLFERFLNPDRVSFPDIDIDFCQDRRLEVIDYVIEKYGEDSVAQVITFGTMGAKGSINDSARIQQVPEVVARKISKEIPDKPGIKLIEVYNQNTKFWDKWREEDYYVSKTWDLALRIEGFIRNHGTHAAAVVISNQPIFEKAPVYKIKDTNAIGFEGKYLEEADLVKYDFLGLKTLTVIDYTLKNIKEAYGKEIDLDMIETTDKKVFEYIASGDTSGMFQIESGGMISLAKKLQPSNFDEVTAMLALFRPGPMEAGMLDSFVERKHGREEVDYFFDSMEEVLKPILEPTYGMIVYQEQVMQIVRAIAGFSLGESDLVRRAMGKKNPEEMEKVKKDFVDGAEKNGYKREEAIELFASIEKFAGYGFNKSHSAAYALITYYTAFLKYYYPAEFMTSLIQLEINSKAKKLDKVAIYVEEAKRMGIEVVPPNIETSTLEFKTKDGKIYYGLRGIKSVGDGVVDFIKAYKDYYNGDILKFFWNVQSDHSKNLEKLEKKKNTLENRLVKIEEAIIRKNTSLLKKIETQENKLIKLEENKLKLEDKKNKSLISDSGLSEKEESRLEKIYEEITKIKKLISDLKNENSFVFPEHSKKELVNNELEELENEISYLKKNKIDIPKIKKSDFEGLAAVGALSPFGVSRKFLIENMSDILDPKKVLDVKITKEEYSMSELIPLEMNFLHTTITSPFGDNLSDYKSMDMPENMHIVTVLSKVEKKKKDGKYYEGVSLKSVHNEVFDVNDFNGYLKKYEIGDVLVAMIQINGKYQNLRKVSPISFAMKNFEKKKTILKLDLLEEIPSELKYDIIEIYENNKILMRLFK